MREKVSPQATDEGLKVRLAAHGPDRCDPSSDLLRRPPSPARGEGSFR
ncbi:hypothetical protein G5B46_04805 [Caulobacter sp. 602-2]|uniref:Uncharacterized protein n=1 Tax=Caulobacter sp. 602-2 TaxID=2710887 RepID=A0A6G4QU04_9CAUL|nr:hypothetical protein [Caulobacter sp. 602-2]NGM48919.1 hypothetical protein [Caulobacter sp. 602-2]